MITDVNLITIINKKLKVSSLKYGINWWKKWCSKIIWF